MSPAQIAERLEALAGMEGIPALRRRELYRLAQAVRENDPSSRALAPQGPPSWWFAEHKKGGRHD